MPATALHVSPHPDDECLGAGPTLLSLRAHGWRVVNLACSFGTNADAAPRRRAELTRACAALDFELRDLEPAVALRSADARPAHEVVGRGVRDALAARDVRPRWWLWNHWGAAARPARARPHATLGAELVFGWGTAPPSEQQGADLLTDRGPGWRAAAPRCLDPADPLAPARAGHDAGPLLHEPSPRARAEHPEPDA